MAVVTRSAVALAAIVALLVGGCGGDRDEAPPPSATQKLSDEPPPLMPAMPLPDNAVDNAVAKLDGLATDLMNTSGIPGMAVAVVHGGKTLYAKGFGVKDVKAAADNPANKVDADTVFQLASLSKPLGATVIAHQVGQNAISWDTPVVSKLPWFALSDPAITRMVTIGDMYAHRSGLPDHAGDQLEDLGYDRRYVLDHLRALPLAPFRISYAYTNFGVTAAADAVAVGAGKSWEDLAAEVLYRPLGMASTSSRFADYAARRNRAVGHIHVDGEYAPDYVRDADPQAPAGGVSSSVNDMTHWMAMMLGNGTFEGRQIVDAKALLPAVTPQIVSSPAAEPAMRSGFYGYGFNVANDIGRPHADQPLRRVRTGCRHQLPDDPVGRRGHRRADQCHADRRTRGAHRPVRRPGAVRRDPAGLATSSTTTMPSCRWRRRRVRWSANPHRLNQHRRNHFRRTPAAMPTTTGGRRGSPRRVADSPWHWGPNWLCRWSTGTATPSPSAW